MIGEEVEEGGIISCLISDSETLANSGELVIHIDK
jgi:hypothetical protein